MKKQYFSPAVETYKMLGMKIMAGSETIKLSNEEADEGGFSKQWSGSLWDDTNNEE